MSSPYLPKNSSYYWIRKRVPEDLRLVAGQREVKRSLKTRDHQEARRLAPAVIAEIEQYFARLRRSLTLNASDIEALTGEYFRERLDAVIQQAQREQWDSESFGPEHTILDELDDSIPLGLTPEEHKSWRRGKVSQWGQEAIQPLLERHGLKPTAPVMERLGVVAFKAELATYPAAYAQLFGDPNWQAPRYAEASLQTTASLPELWPDYAKSARLAPRTQDSWKTYVERASKFLGHKPASTIKKHDIQSFADALLSGDTKATPKGKPLSAKTVNDNYLAAVSALYKWALNKGPLKDDKTTEDPTKGVSVKGRASDGSTKRGYTREQVATILMATRERSSVRTKPETANIRRWAPWLCAFTGARISELLWLRREDLQFTEGLAYINIQAEADTARSVKTSESTRSVPLHPAIIAEGFLDYWRSLPKDESYLFPGPWSDQNGDRAKTPANKLRDWIKTVALPEADWNRLSPNHSFRHWLTSECRRARIDGDHQRVITGHKAKDVHGRYGPADVPTLYEELESIPSPLEPSRTE